MSLKSFYNQYHVTGGEKIGLKKYFCYFPVKSTTWMTLFKQLQKEN